MKKLFCVFCIMFLVVPRYTKGQGEQGNGIPLYKPSDKEIVEISKRMADQDDIVAPSKKYCEILSAIPLSYDVEYRVNDRQPEKFRVYSSRESLLVEWTDKFVLAISNDNGGFLLSAVNNKFNLVNLITASDLVDKPFSWSQFEQVTGLSNRGLHLFGGDATSTIWHTHEIINPIDRKITSREKLPGDKLRVRYSLIKVDSDPLPATGSGFVVIDSSMSNLVCERQHSQTDGSTDLTQSGTSSYYSSYEGIPYPLLKDCSRTETFGGKAKSVTRVRMSFSNYKKESPPADKLKLVYYIPTLPEDLVAKPSRSRWPYYIVAGVLALVGVGVWLARRKRMTGA